MERICYFNGEFVPESQTKVPFTDRGLRLGDAVFEMERTFNGQVFKLREHIERLNRSLKIVRIDPGLTLEELEEITEEVVRRNDPARESGSDDWVYQAITRGNGLDGKRHVTTYSMHKGLSYSFLSLRPSL